MLHKLLKLLWCLRCSKYLLLKYLNSFIENRIDVVFHLRENDLQINFSYHIYTTFSGPFKTIPVVVLGVGVGKQVLIRLT